MDSKMNSKGFKIQNKGTNCKIVYKIRLIHFIKQNKKTYSEEIS